MQIACGERHLLYIGFARPEQFEYFVTKDRLSFSAEIKPPLGGLGARKSGEGRVPDCQRI
jgi:hypothetical protein